MAEQKLLTGRGYSLGIIGNSTKVHQTELREIFLRSAARHGLRFSSTGDNRLHTTNNPVIVITVPNDLPFNKMQPVMDTIAEKLGGRLILSLEESILGKKFREMDDPVHRMAEESILTTSLYP